jgi:hypothetical protein
MVRSSVYRSFALVLLLLFAAPSGDSMAQLLPLSLRAEASVTAIPPGWRVYAPAVCSPAAPCVASKATVSGSETADYETSETAFGLALLGYAIGGTIGGFTMHAVAPTPEDRYRGTPVRELLVGSVVGAVSAGTVLHVVDGRNGHYGYTTGGAVVGNLVMVGLGSLLARLGRSRRSEGLGWFAIYTFAVTPFVSVAVADAVNEHTAR